MRKPIGFQPGLAWTRGKLLSRNSSQGAQGERRGTSEFGGKATRPGDEFFPQSISDTSGARKRVFRIIRSLSGRAAKFRAIGHDEFGLTRHRGNSMRFKEFATQKYASKPAPKDAIKAETIKHQQQKLADRDAQLKVQSTEKHLAQ